MRLRYTATARAAIDDILAHIATDNPTAAAAAGAAIKGAIARLGSFPRVGAETDESGVYIKDIVWPYRLIFYSIDGEWIVVRDVRYPARRGRTNAQS